MSIDEDSFFDMEECSHHEENKSVNGSVDIQKEEEIISSLPKVESFIIPKKQDSFYLKFMTQEPSEMEDCSVSLNRELKNQPRMKRWLKKQDRKMVSLILDLTRTSPQLQHFILKNMKEEKETQTFWKVIKDRLNTSRSAGFLQSRYMKLLQNQKLNSKEFSLLADKYDEIPIEKFMIIFPGKSELTLRTLIEKLKEKDEKIQQKRAKVEPYQANLEPWNSATIHNIQNVLSIRTDKMLSVQVDCFNGLPTVEYLKALDKTSLRKLSYNINQVAGELYAKLHKAKTEILQSLP